MTIAQIRKIKELTDGYNADAKVKFRQWAGGGISLGIYNLEHFVTPTGGYFSFSKNGDLIDSGV